MIRGCIDEAGVARAALTGDWSDEIRAHAEQCPQCGAVALVAGELGAARRQPVLGEVPDAGRVWRIAQLRVRRAAAERATLSIAVVEAVALAAAAVLGAFAVVRLVDAMTPWTWTMGDSLTPFLGGGVGVSLSWVMLGTLVLGTLLEWCSDLLPSRD